MKTTQKYYRLESSSSHLHYGKQQFWTKSFKNIFLFFKYTGWSGHEHEQSSQRKKKESQRKEKRKIIRKSTYFGIGFGWRRATNRRKTKHFEAL